LAPAGSGHARDAKCAVPQDEECLRKLVEDEAAGRREANRAVRDVLRGRRRAVQLAALQWVLVFAVVRSADSRLVVGQTWGQHFDRAYALCTLGSLAGALFCALAAYVLLWRPGGTLRGWALCAAPALSLALGCGLLVMLLLTERLRRVTLQEWTAYVDFLSDEAYRHASCANISCQYMVAFTTAFAQTLIVGGISLAVFAVGAACCPRCLKRRQCMVASAAAILLAGAAAAIWVVRSLQFAKDVPERELWHAIVFFYLTQVLARCGIPLGALCTFTACWGWPASRRKGKPQAIPPEGSSGADPPPRSTPPAPPEVPGEAPMTPQTSAKDDEVSWRQDLTGAAGTSALEGSPISSERNRLVEV